MHELELAAIYRRAQLALEASAAVLASRACLTQGGAEYLGVPFRRRYYRPRWQREAMRALRLA